jgi:hypothetical protein
MKPINIKVLFFALFLIPLSNSNIFAQGYGTAIGVRGGDGIGLTLKQQIALRHTAELIAQKEFQSKRTTISLLAMRHINLITRNINFYAGGGGHYSYYDESENKSNHYGVSGIVGFEMNFGNINVSADYKPRIYVNTYPNLGGVGISVRYIIAERYFKDESWKFWKKKNK